MFKVTLKPRAEKQFVALSKKLKVKFLGVFTRLEFDPFTGDIQKISGTDHGYRMRVGRWRALMAVSFDKKTIEVVDIFLKKGAQDYHQRRDLL